ncbi:MAG TPA: response regulator [Nitrososphaeraceae archaeon]|nr:response regulator [Nitrososphaeraceae archaeon]
MDDEKDVIFLLTTLLRENSYQVIGFTNPLIALDYISKYPYDFSLIIIDYRMSPMQGCELSNKISKINPNIKMVLITAYNNIINNDLNLEIVRKPITNTKLLEVIHRYL